MDRPGPRARAAAASAAASSTTAPLPPGSSGGPVLDADGQLLGINTNRLGEGFYLALPADHALRTQADALARGESAAPPQLGIAIAPPHVAKRLRRAVGLPDTEGLLIQQVPRTVPPAPRRPLPGRPDRGSRAGRSAASTTCTTHSTRRRAAPSNSASCAAPTSGPTQVLFTPETEGN